MAKQKAQLEKTGIMLVVTYFVLFFVSSVTLLILNSFFPRDIVLGTFYISKTWALIYSMGVLSLIHTFAVPFVREYEKHQGEMISNRDWMMLYFFLNFVGIYFLTRFANQLGFGITSWRVALVLAVIFDLVQGAAMMAVEKIRNST